MILRGIIIKDVTVLPAIVAGPILRHCDTKQVNFWLVTSQDYAISCCINRLDNGDSIFSRRLTSDDLQKIRIGTHAFINLITLSSDDIFPENTLLTYDFTLSTRQGHSKKLVDVLPDLIYANQQLPTFIIK